MVAGRSPVGMETASAPARIVAGVAVVAWSGLIFALSSISDARISVDEQVDWVVRKAAHITEFAILAFLVATLLTLLGARRAIGLAFVVTVLYAASDEVHQAFLPGRGPSPIDVMIDSIGAAIGVVLWIVVRRWRARGQEA